MEMLRAHACEINSGCTHESTILPSASMNFSQLGTCSGHLVHIIEKRYFANDIDFLFTLMLPPDPQ